MVLILYDGTKWVRLGLTRFPSPYGDYGSYLHPLQYDYDSFQTSFRPLTGIMVLIAIDSRSNWIGNLLCFRPLTGIMVLICTDDTLDIIFALDVSVPLRGLWFLSL